MVALVESLKTYVEAVRAIGVVRAEVATSQKRHNHSVRAFQLVEIRV